MNDDGPAYPYRNEYGFNEGMSLRDHFAGLAMQAWAIAYSRDADQYPDDERVAKDAYVLADAMLKERARREEKT